jgi:hypothetical protein
VLDLSLNDLGDDALWALARSPYLDGLYSLGVTVPENASPEARTAFLERFRERLPFRDW